MSNIRKSLAWAGAIIVAAFLASVMELSAPASSGIVLGLATAALGNLQSETPCALGCLQ